MTTVDTILDLVKHSYTPMGEDPKEYAIVFLEDILNEINLKLFAFGTSEKLKNGAYIEEYSFYAQLQQAYYNILAQLKLL